MTLKRETRVPLLFFKSNEDLLTPAYRKQQKQSKNMFMLYKAGHKNMLELITIIAVKTTLNMCKILLML